MNRKLRIGVFGGCRGKVMIDVLLKHPHAELVAVCDKYQPLLDEVGKKALEFGLDVKCFLDFEDFIKYDTERRRLYLPWHSYLTKLSKRKSLINAAASFSFS